MKSNKIEQGLYICYILLVIFTTGKTRNIKNEISNENANNKELENWKTKHRIQTSSNSIFKTVCGENYYLNSDSMNMSKLELFLINKAKLDTFNFNQGFRSISNDAINDTIVSIYPLSYMPNVKQFSIEEIIWNEEILYLDGKYEPIYKHIPFDSLEKDFKFVYQIWLSFEPDSTIRRYKKDLPDSIINLLTFEALLNFCFGEYKIDDEKIYRVCQQYYDFIETCALDDLEKGKWLIGLSKILANLKVQDYKLMLKCLWRANYYLKSNYSLRCKVIYIELNLLNFTKKDFTRNFAIKRCEQLLQDPEFVEEYQNIYSYMAYLSSMVLRERKFNRRMYDSADLIKLLYCIVNSIDSYQDLTRLSQLRTHVAMSNYFRMREDFQSSLLMNQCLVMEICKIKNRYLFDDQIYTLLYRINFDREVLELPKLSQFLGHKVDIYRGTISHKLDAFDYDPRNYIKKECYLNDWDFAIANSPEMKEIERESLYRLLLNQSEIFFVKKDYMTSSKMQVMASNMLIHLPIHEDQAYEMLTEAMQESFDMIKNEQLNKITTISKTRVILLLIIILAVSLLVWYYRLTNKLIIAENKLRMEYAFNRIKSSSTYFDNHFISNLSLQLKNYIRNKEPNKAKQLLGNFITINQSILSSLKRTNFILEDDVKLAEKYLEIQKELMLDFDFKIIRPKNWEIIKTIQFPYGLLQLFCENSINHGLFHKKGQKTIIIRINQTEIILTDDGIGRDMSRELSKSIKKESYGTDIASSKVNAFNEYYNRQISFSYIDSQEGTKVRISI